MTVRNPCPCFGQAQNVTKLNHLNLTLKAYRLSELNFVFILKVANIRCFILIKCSEQKARFKKSVIICRN